MDELVRRLRKKAEAFDYDGWVETASDYEKAADALEELQADKAALNGTVSNLIQQIAELSKDLERSKEWETFWEKEANEALKKFQITVASKPRWIPVEERLPCLTTPVLATDGIEVDIAWMYGVPPRWITSFTAIDDDKLTHWMPFPQTPKGE